MINIVCVLKSGGDFDSKYVNKLYDGLLKYCVYRPFKFYCFSDINVKDLDATDIISLKLNLPGWWSKLEIFKLTGPTLYLDLDTVLVGDITNLINEVIEHENTFMMLDAFHHSREFASGIMAWNGNWAWVRDKALAIMQDYTMDQDCIVDTLKQRSVPIYQISRKYHNIVSYKWHCQHGTPESTDIICFHGKPRPHEVLKDW